MKWLMMFAILVGFVEAKNFAGENYFIKRNYISRTIYHHHDDTALQDEFQNEVYEEAFNLAQEYDLERIADIGCGSGFKLLKYFDHKDTIGFEIEPTLSFLRAQYPFHKWMESAFNRKPPRGPGFDLIICSDVIEHLVDPDALLNWIDQFEFQFLVISTPDRSELTNVWTDNIQGPQSQSGPPVNYAHVREWDYLEFEKYIGQYFEVISHYHCDVEFYGQIIVAKKKPQ